MNVPNEEQLTISDRGNQRFDLEFPYNEDFIAFLKMKVPYQDRGYDEDTRTWTVVGEKYIGHLEGVGLQKFRHVTRQFKQGPDLVIRNVRTGAESVQRGLF